MRSVLAIGFALSVGALACHLLTDVDVDKVKLSDDGGSSGTLPDGAPKPTTDSGLPSGTCTGAQVECLAAAPAPNGLACCPKNDDVGAPQAIAAGGSNTCATTTTGQIRCWGGNGLGQLGRGVDALLQSSNKPLNVFRIPAGAKQVTVGQSYACAIVNDLFTCWGANNFGQFGNGGTDNSPIPIVIALSDVPDAIGAGAQTTCASLKGKGHCWGDNNAFQGGSEGEQRIVTPRAVTSLPNLAPGAGSIAPSRNHSCAVGGAAFFCWGNNSSGRLGSNGPTQTGTATAVTNGALVGKNIVAGESHACAIVGAGLRCWGSNVFGELGNDAIQLKSDGAITPTGMTTNVTSICAGFGHTCAVQAGKVRCTGEGTKGQTGTGASSRVFVDVPGLTGAKQVACGQLHTCALFDDGKIKCFGQNDSGQLGAGISDPQSNTPRDVAW